MFCCTSIFGVDGFRALAVAAGEGADQRDVHAADEADLARLGGHGGGDADQVGAFLFLEQDRVHVLAGGVTVDQDEVHVREFGRDLCTAWVCEKPIAAIRSSFLRARPRSTCSAWVSLLAWASNTLMPVSFLKRCSAFGKPTG
jgi:hypothetical protein